LDGTPGIVDLCYAAFNMREMISSSKRD
jgi:hypothetical protein